MQRVRKIVTLALRGAVRSFLGLSWTRVLRGTQTIGCYHEIEVIVLFSFSRGGVYCPLVKWLICTALTP